MSGEQLGAIFVEMREVERYRDELWSILAEVLGEETMGWLQDFIKVEIKLAALERRWEEETK